ncbi:hypothetical protein CsSME_00044047 [Camellia sinensis var. sinensis]
MDFFYGMPMLPVLYKQSLNVRATKMSGKCSSEDRIGFIGVVTVEMYGGGWGVVFDGGWNGFCWVVCNGGWGWVPSMGVWVFQYGGWDRFCRVVV